MPIPNQCTECDRTLPAGRHGLCATCAEEQGNCLVCAYLPGRERCANCAADEYQGVE